MPSPPLLEFSQDFTPPRTPVTLSTLLCSTPSATVALRTSLPSRESLSEPPAVTVAFAGFSAVVLVVAVRAEVALLSRPEAAVIAPAAEEAAPVMTSRVALIAEAFTAIAETSCRGSGAGFGQRKLQVSATGEQAPSWQHCKFIKCVLQSGRTAEADENS